MSSKRVNKRSVANKRNGASKRGRARGTNRTFGPGSSMARLRVANSTRWPGYIVTGIIGVPKDVELAYKRFVKHERDKEPRGQPLFIPKFIGSRRMLIPTTAEHAPCAQCSSMIPGVACERRDRCVAYTWHNLMLAQDLATVIKLMRVHRPGRTPGKTAARRPVGRG